MLHFLNQKEVGELESLEEQQEMSERVTLRHQFLKLTCVRCGGETFRVSQEKLEQFGMVEGASYIFQEDFGSSEVQCETCGLEDYLQNLPLVFAST